MPRLPANPPHPDAALLLSRTIARYALADRRLRARLRPGRARDRHPAEMRFRVPVLRVFPPAAFVSVAEAAAATGVPYGRIWRAANRGKLAGGAVWCRCPLHLLRRMRPDLEGRGEVVAGRSGTEVAA